MLTPPAFMAHPNQDFLDRLSAAERDQRRPRLERLARSPGRALRAKLLGGLSRGLDAAILIKTETFWGGKMTVALPEPVSDVIHRYGVFEAGAARALLFALRPGQTFFDVGAHFGFFSLLGAQVVGPSGRVVSFEPTPRTFAILTTNLAAVPHASAEPCAVFSREGRVRIRDLDLTLSAYNSIFAPRLQGAAAAHDFVSIEVRAVALDDYARATGLRPDVVKIDAESAEHEVLLGMEELLREKRPAIVMEVGDVGVEAATATRELIAHLEARGYQAFECDGETPTLHVPRARYGHMNLLFQHPAGT